MQSVYRVVRQFKFPRSVSLFVLGIVVGGIFVFGLGGGKQKTEDLSSPLVLERVQELGELRTVSHRYSRVMSYESHKEAEGWLARVPLVDEVVAGATRNKVLVTVDGEIQAGVDLGQAKVFERDGAWLIELPKAKIYEPTVDMNVNSRKEGLFWKDLNVSEKARRQAKEEISAASLEGGILKAAEKEAEVRVRSLVTPMTKKRVNVQFREG